MQIIDYSFEGLMINVAGENGPEMFQAQLPLKIFQQHLENVNKIGDVEMEYALSHPDDPSSRSGDVWYLQVSFREYLFQTADHMIYADLSECVGNNITKLKNYAVWVS